jgi:protein TonB
MWKASASFASPTPTLGAAPAVSVWWLALGSLVAHGALGVALGRIEVPRATKRSVVHMRVAPKTPAPERAESVNAPPKSAEAPAPTRPAEAPKVATPAPPREAAPAPPAPAAAATAAPVVANLGITLGAGAGGGVAVAQGSPGGIAGGGGASGTPRVAEARDLAPDRPPAACTEALVKARTLDEVHASYTDEAIASQIEGTVRVEISVDDAGAVSAVRVLQGLGYGLDERALSAARALRFNAASRCGVTEASTVKVAIRFQLP